MPYYTAIGFTGTRTGMTPQQMIAVELILRCSPHKFFHHGDCIGADAEAHRIAEKYHKATVIHPPDNNAYRAYCSVTMGHVEMPADFISRNHAIVDACILLIACPGSMTEHKRSGTWATVRYARKIGRTMVIILPDGSIGR